METQLILSTKEKRNEKEKSHLGTVRRVVGGEEKPSRQVGTRVKSSFSYQV
jgi:hypothetical protein